MESIVPRSPTVNWLLIVWEPGLPWAPVQRYEIRECIPNLSVVPADLVRDLQGESPRERGGIVPVEWSPEQRRERDAMSQEERAAFDVLEGIDKDGKRWVTDALISLKQWQVFQETGCYSQRFWIIQGSKGGHKYRLSAAERSYMQAVHPETPDTPAPGSLPYAPYDRRVREQMIRMDKLRSWTDGQDWSTRGETSTKAGLIVRKQRRANEAYYHGLMLKWLDEQVADVNESVPLRWREAWREKLRTSPAMAGAFAGGRDDEGLEQSLIMDGNTPEEE